MPICSKLFRILLVQYLIWSCHCSRLWLDENYEDNTSLECFPWQSIEETDAENTTENETNFVADDFCLPDDAPSSPHLDFSALLKNSLVEASDKSVGGYSEHQLEPSTHPQSQSQPSNGAGMKRLLPSIDNLDANAKKQRLELDPNPCLPTPKGLFLKARAVRMQLFREFTRQHSLYADPRFHSASLTVHHSMFEEHVENGAYLFPMLEQLYKDLFFIVNQKLPEGAITLQDMWIVVQRGQSLLQDLMQGSAQPAEAVDQKYSSSSSGGISTSAFSPIDPDSYTPTISFLEPLPGYNLFPNHLGTPSHSGPSSNGNSSSHAKPNAVWAPRTLNKINWYQYRQHTALQSVLHKTLVSSFKLDAGIPCRNEAYQYLSMLAAKILEQKASITIANALPRFPLTWKRLEILARRNRYHEWAESDASASNKYATLLGFFTSDLQFAPEYELERLNMWTVSMLKLLPAQFGQMFPENHFKLKGATVQVTINEPKSGIRTFEHQFIPDRATSHGMGVLILVYRAATGVALIGPDTRNPKKQLAILKYIVAKVEAFLEQAVLGTEINPQFPLLTYPLLDRLKALSRYCSRTRFVQEDVLGSIAAAVPQRPDADRLLLLGEILWSVAHLPPVKDMFCSELVRYDCVRGVLSENLG